MLQLQPPPRRSLIPIPSSLLPSWYRLSIAPIEAGVEMDQSSLISAVAYLETVSPCDVADACKRLKIECYMSSVQIRSPVEAIHGSSETPFKWGQSASMVGPAHTIRFVNGQGATTTKPPGHIADTVTDGCVVVISVPTGVVNANWGGLLSARAKHLGGKGVVLDGRCRDLQEHRAMKFPVFSCGVSVHGSSPWTSAHEVGGTIVCDGVSVTPGDIVVGDVNGVVVIPRDRLGEVVQLVKQLAEIDAKCMKDITSGRRVDETFAEHRGKK
eukprot:TRINITY_DN12931_c0_g1_i1.p1 TRINITY_DN12931_c0_g1~~TRINITY_DN12931_c0_g1_i1.p1  ORF type:complete len:270 (+),score=38.63 TRINITY_DN12931_c0_g1_i1:104-913(+)